MPKTRFPIVAMLAAAVLAAGCGGGGDDATDEPDDEAASEVTASGAGQPATTTVSEATDQAAATEPAPELVRLADRFSWCSTHQRTWDRLAEMQQRANDIEAARLDAQAAWDAATDELDIAEAGQAVEAAEENYRDFVPAFRDVLFDATHLLNPDWMSRSGDETEPIAVGRARDAFHAAADPTLLELLDAVRAGIPHPEPAPAVSEPVEEEPLPREELLAALEALRDEADDAAQTSIGAKQAMQSAFLDLQAAQTPEDVMDTYQRFLAAYLNLHELEDTASLIRWTAEHQIHAALRAAGGATDASFRWVEDTKNAVRYVRHIHPWPWDPNRNRIPTEGASFGEVTHAVHGTLEQTVNELVLADPAWTAFQASLSESCQP